MILTSGEAAFQSSAMICVSRGNIECVRRVQTKSRGACLSLSPLTVDLAPCALSGSRSAAASLGRYERGATRSSVLVVVPVSPLWPWSQARARQSERGLISWSDAARVQSAAVPSCRLLRAEPDPCRGARRGRQKKPGEKRGNGNLTGKGRKRWGRETIISLLATVVALAVGSDELTVVVPWGLDVERGPRGPGRR